MTMNTSPTSASAPSHPNNDGSTSTALLNKKPAQAPSSGNGKVRRKARPPIAVKRKYTYNDGLILQVGNVKFWPPVARNIGSGRLFINPEAEAKAKGHYRKREALRHISKTRRGSGERAAMIKFMIAEGYVPVKSKCLYDLVRDTEIHGLPVGDEKWSSVGRPNRKAAARKQINGCGNGWKDKDMFPMRKEEKICEKEAKKRVTLDWKYDRAKPSLWGKKGWKGSIVFPPNILAPISKRDRLEDVEKDWWEYTTKRHTDLCSYIGEPKEGDTAYRVYFCPKKFPGPKDVKNGGECTNFVTLRSYIHDLSWKSGSPVTSNGGGVDKRVFTCQHNRKARCQPGSISCPFGFTVKWDDIGYYIHGTKRSRMNGGGCHHHLCQGK